MAFQQSILIIAVFLCSLVTGFLFAFAVVVMPGIRRLNNGEFIRAFQMIDGIIQNNQPIFMAVWLGSIITLIVAAIFGAGHLDTTGYWLLIGSTVTYLLGVQLPTLTINVPLNNRLQSLNVTAMTEQDRANAREVFEARWNRWNGVRTVSACLATTLLLVLLFRY